MVVCCKWPAQSHWVSPEQRRSRAQILESLAPKSLMSALCPLVLWGKGAHCYCHLSHLIALIISGVHCPKRVSLSVWDAVTESHRLNGLMNTHLFLSSRGWEVQGQGTRRLGVWEELAFWFIRQVSGCVLTWQER